MPIPQTNTLYRCDICGKTYKNFELAAQCESGHDIIVVPFLASDLRRLAAILVTYDPNYATETLVATVQKYNRIKGRVV